MNRICAPTLLFITMIGAFAQSISIGAKAPDIALKDQYDHDTKLSDYKGQLILIIYGDRSGSDYMNQWAAAVRKRFPGGPNRLVTLVYGANLSGVPGILQGWVKGKFQKKAPDGKPNGPVLMDWNAAVAAAFGFHDHLTNVYLVDANGIFRFSAFGKGVPDEVQPLLRMIEDIAGNSSKPHSSGAPGF